MNSTISCGLSTCFFASWRLPASSKSCVRHHLPRCDMSNVWPVSFWHKSLGIWMAKIYVYANPMSRRRPKRLKNAGFCCFSIFTLSFFSKTCPAETHAGNFFIILLSPLKACRQTGHPPRAKIPRRADAWKPKPETGNPSTDYPNAQSAGRNAWTDSVKRQDRGVN